MAKKIGFAKILQVVTAIAVELETAQQDEQITVGELIDTIKSGVDAAGYSDHVIIDLKEEEETDGNGEQ